MSRFDRLRVIHPEGGESMTKQAFKDEVDINKIIERYAEYGVQPLASGQPKYGDFSDGFSFHDALSAVREVEEDFAALPARVRDACENDPGKYLDFVSDPEKRKELEGLGLVEAQVPEQVIAAAAETAQEGT